MEIDPLTGAFVALCPLDEGTTATYTALGADGAVLDATDFTRQAYDWDDDPAD